MTRGNQTMQRREFLRTTGRYSLLTAIAAVLGFLGFARRGAACQRQFICGECPKFAGCPLPEAAKARSRVGDGSAVRREEKKEAQP